MTGKNRMALLIMSAIVYAVNVIDRQLLPLMAELVRKDIGLEDWQLGLLTGMAFAICYALLTLPLAWVADSGNRRNLVATCLMLFSVATAVCGLVQNFFQLVLARMAVALGEAGTTPATLSMLADRFPDRRGFASAALTAGAHLGILVGVLMVANLAELLGWRMTFVATGVLGVVISVIYVMLVREPERIEVRSERAYRSALATLARHRSFRFATLLMIGLLFFNNATAAWIPAFLMRAHGLSISDVGLFSGLTGGLIGMICVLAAGPLVDRFTRADIRWVAWLPAIIIALMIATTAIGLVTSSTTIALLCLGVAPCITLVGQTCAFVVVQSAIPHDLRATATAMLFLVANLIGMGLGPTLVGTLSSYWAETESLALRSALLVGIVPASVGIIGALLLARHLKADCDQTARSSTLV